jgi:hypothetical protein
LVIKVLDPDWIRIRIRIGGHPKMLDPDPDEMNADPQPWMQLSFDRKKVEKSYAGTWQYSYIMSFFFLGEVE